MREDSFVYIYKRTQARSSALLKFQVFWSDVLFQRSPADFVLKAHGTYSQNSLERESNQIFCEIRTKRERRLMPLNSLTGALCVFEFTNKNTQIPSRLIMPPPGLIIQAWWWWMAENLISAAACATAFALQTQFLRPARATSMLCFICNYLLLAYWHRAYAPLCDPAVRFSFWRRDSLSVSLVLHFNSQSRQLFWCFFLQSTMIN